MALKILNKGFFANLFIKISLLTVTLILVLSSVLFYVSQQSMYKNIILSNELMLTQISNTIKTMHDSIRQFTVSLYNSYPVTMLMNERDPDILEQSVAANNIEEYISSNPFVHTVYVINRSIGRYYSMGAYSSAGGYKFFDMDVTNIFKPEINLKPIPREIPLSGIKEDEYINGYSYILCKKPIGSWQSGCAVVVNMKAEWFFGNIDVSYSDMKTLKNNIGIIDQKGVLVADSACKRFMQDISSERYIGEILRSDKGYGSFVSKVETIDSLVTYIYIKELNWYIFSTIPQHIITAPVDNIRNITLIICAVALFIALLFSFFLSKRLYNPVGSLVNEVRSMKDSDENKMISDNEFNYISSSIKETIENINSLKSFQKDNMHILRENLIKSLLMQEEKYDPVIGRKLYEYGIGIDPNKKIAVILLRIDDYTSFCEQNLPDDRNVYRYAIQNISGEIFTAYFKCISIENEDQITTIINFDENSHEDRDVKDILMKLIKEIQESVMKNFRLSLSASISSISNSISDIETLYKEVLELSNYRIVRGYGCIITSESFRISSNLSFEYPVGVAKEIVDALKLSKPLQANEYYNSFISNVSSYSYNNIRFAVTHLFLSISNMLNQIKSSGIVILDKDYAATLERINRHETIDRINGEFYGMFKTVAEKIERSRDDKTKKNIKTAMDFINGNYTDPNLSTNTVAERVMMSPVYFGMVFREATSKSIYDYINEVRLQKAEELLRSTDCSIAGILGQIGWENQKYFYVKFKKHFGVTPSTYRTNNLAGEIE